MDEQFGLNCQDYTWTHEDLEDHRPWDPKRVVNITCANAYPKSANSGCWVSLTKIRSWCFNVLELLKYRNSDNLIILVYKNITLK